jgi:hypothetical protein
MNFMRIWPGLLMAAATVTFGGLWIVESLETVELSADLAQARTELTTAESELKELRKQNQRLRNDLQELPLLEFSERTAGERDSRSGRLPSTDWDQADGDRQDARTADTAAATEEAAGRTSGAPERERTPEEEAERAARRAEREQQREEMRQQMTMELQERREFFSQISLEGLSPEYAEANLRLIEAMGEMQVLLTEISQEGLTRDQRREIWSGMRENSREVRRLMGTQKDILLFDYAEVELGLDAEQKQQFLDYMRMIDTYTTTPRGFGRMR